MVILQEARRVTSFFICWAGLAGVVGVGGDGAWSDWGATRVAWWEEREATPEDRSLRAAWRLDVTAGEDFHLGSEEGYYGAKVIDNGNQLGEKRSQS